jgi:2'-5' RNA ligase
MTKRLFIAVPVQDKSRIQIVRGILNNDIARKMPVRWTAYENLHLTMQFLGDVEEKRITELKEILDNCKTADCENLCFENLGAFPNNSAPRIIWLGFKKCQSLLNLQRSITNGLAAKGFPYDQKRFKPHLTLGRVKENSLIRAESFADLEALAFRTEISETPLDRIVLFASQLRPAGPIYTALYEKNCTPKGYTYFT